VSDKKISVCGGVFVAREQQIFCVKENQKRFLENHGVFIDS
jgi:hypothetical protein